MKHFLGLLLIGAISVASSDVYAQANRDFGARRLSLDDNSGNRILLQTPPSGGWTGSRTWNIPLPPNDVIESGFTAKGALSGEILTWNATLNFWEGNTIADLGLVTATPAGTVNALPKFTSASNIGNSVVTDDGTAVRIDATDVVIDYATGITTFGTQLIANQNIDVRGHLFDASGALTINDQIEALSSLQLGGALTSSGVTLTIDDNLQINGTLSNTNPFEDLVLADNLRVTGSANIEGPLRNLTGALVIDDQLEVTNSLQLGGSLTSPGATVTIDDNLAINGTLSNPDAFQDLVINDNVRVVGEVNFESPIRSLTGALIVDDQLQTNNGIQIGGALTSAGATVTIDDDLRISGTLANTNLFTDLVIDDNVTISGITNFLSSVRSLSGAFIIDDQLQVNNSVQIGGPLSATGASVTIDDNLMIAGELSNTNLFQDLVINDNIRVTGISNFDGVIRSLTGALMIDDQLNVSGTTVFQQSITAPSFLINSPAAASAITFGDANPNRTGLSINNVGNSPTSIGLNVGNLNRTQDGIKVAADRYALDAQTESFEVNSAGAGFDGAIVPSTIGDVGAAVIARGRASAGGAEQYSNAIILQNGAFAVAGTAPAGRIENMDLSIASSAVVNNPLCTTSSLVLLTPVSQDGADARLYVSAASDGSFTVSRAGAAVTGIDFNYFIITVVNP